VRLLHEVPSLGTEGDHRDREDPEVFSLDVSLQRVEERAEGGVETR